METVYKFIGLICFITFSQQLKSQSIDELTIFNSLLDSIYNINTCQKIIYPPYFKCCNQDTLYGDKIVECCQTSTVAKEYRVYCSHCINKQELDSLNQIMVINDSLSTLDLLKSKKYLLTQISKTSRFYDFIKNIKKPLRTRGFSLDSLKQGNIKFMTIEEFNNSKYEHRFGKTGKDLFLGYFDLSRIYADIEKGLAIFAMNWLGGGTCGYKKLILIYRDGIKWKIEKKIWLGVY